MRTLSVILLLAACGDDHAHEDAASTPDVLVDATPDCTASGVSEAQALRETDAASVKVTATFLNALEHCAKAELRFGLVMDTHSVDLMGIDIATSAAVEVEGQPSPTGPFWWAGGSESSHHRDGVLSVASPSVSQSIWLRLTVRQVAGVDREFEWDEPMLEHDQP